MSSTVMVAVDGSKNAAHAADIATSLAAALGDALVVLHVHEVAVGGYGRIRINEGDGSAEVAQKAVEQAVAAGVKAKVEEREALNGHVADIIARTASELDVRLVAVGIRARSGPAALLMGSTTRRLLHESKVPVLTVPLP